MKALKKTFIALAAAVVVLAGIFLAGRFGWKPAGFRACHAAGITSVEAGENAVHITGFCPGSFPEGFCGYCAVEQDGRLYVGFRFSAVLGLFETGDFDVTIPVEGKIDEVIMRYGENESVVWNAQAE